MESCNQRKVINEWRDFVNSEIKPFASKFDELNELPVDLIKKIGDARFLTPTIPKSFGGLGLDPIFYGEFIEIIGKSCSSIRTLLTVHNSLVAETLLKWGTELQKNMWLPNMATGKTLAAFALSEPSASANVKNIETSFKKIGNKYVLTGRKKWISFGGLANFFLVVAKDEKDNGTVFIVRREDPGVTVVPMEDLIAGRATYLSEIRLENCCLDLDRVVAKEGLGFTHVVPHALDHGRYCIAWAGVAIAETTLELASEYVTSRDCGKDKIAGYQYVQGIIGHATAITYAARSLCLQAGKYRAEKKYQGIVETVIAKYYSSTVANDVINECIKVFGANALNKVMQVERIHREAKVLEIIEGTPPVMHNLIAMHAFSKYTNKKNSRN